MSERRHHRRRSGEPSQPKPLTPLLPESESRVTESGASSDVSTSDQQSATQSQADVANNYGSLAPLRASHPAPTAQTMDGAARHHGHDFSQITLPINPAITTASSIQTRLIQRKTVKEQLNEAMDGWGTDEDAIFRITEQASDAEKREILDDPALVARLADELSREDMLRVLANLRAPLKQRLNVAMDGWGTDEDAIFEITRNASATEKREVAEDTVLMRRIMSELGASDMQQVITNLGLLGVANASQSTDTGNTYTSLVVLFPNGVNISKDVQFIEAGTFSAGAFDALKGRIIASVTNYLSGKYRLKIESADGTPQNGDGVYPITVRVVDNPAADYPMTLHGGAHGRSGVSEDGGDIYELGQASETSIPDITLAHECAHMMLGASDEYENESVEGRVVHTDHSLMGHFYNEGVDAAEIKARHFKMLVDQVKVWFPDRNISIVK